MRRRRRNSGISPVTLLLLAALGVGGWFAYKKFAPGRETFAGTPDLVVADYFNNANSLRGNIYRLRATVDDSLRWSPGQGRLLSVVPKSADGISGDPVPVKIPASLNENIQAGQDFIFKVRVGEGGVLVAEEMKRS